MFADVDPRTLNLDLEAVEAAITDRTKAIVAVDMFGYPCELDELRTLAERRGLVLIEDAAEALGAEYKGRPIGSHGPSAVFGFYPNKQITTGEGGVVVTHSEEELRQLVSLRNQGRSYAGGGWFHHVQVGFNYRWTDIQAAIGVGQLEKLDRILSLRREAADRYTDLLAGLDAVQPLSPDDADHRRSWFVYVVQLASGIDRDDVMAALAGGRHRDRRVRPVRPPPAVHARALRVLGGACPVAEDASRRTLALPFHTRIHEADQQRVVRGVWVGGPWGGGGGALGGGGSGGGRTAGWRGNPGGGGDRAPLPP